jgi:hypothetical protein
MASGNWQVVRDKMYMLLRVKEKNEEAQLSIDPKRWETLDFFIHEREAKLMPTTKAGAQSCVPVLRPPHHGGM